jgi:3-methyl-2-oxobutanoate hydroxymethyltransferase
MTEKITTDSLKQMKQAGEKIASLTAYDASFARIEDKAGVDVILVGDSLGMVLHGEETTLQVTVEDMVYHSKQVSRACQRSMIICDMPYKSYLTPKEAIENATRLVNEGGADMVKLEGGEEIADIISAIKKENIAVCGHLGLMPQSFENSKDFKVQATTEETAEKLKQDALAIEEAGCDCMVFECIPADVAKHVTQELNVPTIGIGAGVDCDGQVLVVHDMLGITGKKFRFLKNFLEGNDSIETAISNYVSEVKGKTFPTTQHSF